MSAVKWKWKSSGLSLLGGKEAQRWSSYQAPLQAASLCLAHGFTQHQVTSAFSVDVTRLGYLVVHSLSIDRVFLNVSISKTQTRFALNESPNMNSIYQSITASSYPLRGVWLVLVGRGYRRLLLSNAGTITSVILSIIISPIFIQYAFNLQYNFLSEYLRHGQSAWISCSILTLAENIALLQLMHPLYFLMDETRTEIFDVSREVDI